METGWLCWASDFCHSLQWWDPFGSNILLELDLIASFIFLGQQVDVIPEDSFLKDGKHLYQEAIGALSALDGLVVNVECVEHIQTRLLDLSPDPGQNAVAVLLLNDKNDTPSMFKLLAYCHRGEGIAFGEGKGANVAQLSQQFGVNFTLHSPNNRRLCGPKSRKIQW